MDETKIVAFSFTEPIRRSIRPLYFAEKLLTKKTVLRTIATQPNTLTTISKVRAESRTRTGDPRITNALRYQLRYFGSL